MFLKLNVQILRKKLSTTYDYKVRKDKEAVEDKIIRLERNREIFDTPYLKLRIEKKKIRLKTQSFLPLIIKYIIDSNKISLDIAKANALNS